MLIPSPIRCRIAGRPCGVAGTLTIRLLAVDFLPKSFGFDDRGFGIHRQIGRDFEADETVVAVEMIVNRAQHVRRMLDIFDGEMLEQLGDRAVAAFQCSADRAVIFVGTADGLFKDRRIRRDALDAVGVDQLFQVAFGDEAAGQEIQPDRLTVIFECFDRIHDACFCSGWSNCSFRDVFWREAEFCQQRPRGRYRPREYGYPDNITPLTSFRSPEIG